PLGGAQGFVGVQASGRPDGAQVEVERDVTGVFDEVVQVQQPVGLAGAAAAEEDLVVGRIDQRGEGPGGDVGGGQCRAIGAFGPARDPHERLVEVQLAGLRHATPWSRVVRVNLVP